MSADRPFVRRARREDLAALLALESQFPTDRISRGSFCRLIARGHADIWVIEDQGTIRGNTVLLYRRNSRTARMYSLVVHPDYRGRGLGAQLMQAAERGALAKGCVALALEVRPDNTAAQELYRKHGYAMIGTRADFYQDHSPAVRMHKALNATKTRLLTTRATIATV
jgi:ribosomal protein S18 acetylase RimI-like enzyme